MPTLIQKIACRRSLATPLSEPMTVHLVAANMRQSALICLSAIKFDLNSHFEIRILLMRYDRGKHFSVYSSIPLQWRHNERESVSKHRRLDCLTKHLFRCGSRKTSKFRVTGLCEANPPQRQTWYTDQPACELTNDNPYFTITGELLYLFIVFCWIVTAKCPEWVLFLWLWINHSPTCTLQHRRWDFYDYLTEGINTIIDNMHCVTVCYSISYTHISLNLRMTYP